MSKLRHPKSSKAVGSADQSSKNYFPDQSALRILTSPGKRKIFSPFIPIERNSTPGAQEFCKWMSKHRHTHPFYEVMLSLRGTIWYGVDNAVFQCRPGAMLIVGPNQPHTNRYRMDDAVEHIWLSFITPEQAFLQLVTVSSGKVKLLHGDRSLINIGHLSMLLRTMSELTGSDRPTGIIQTRLLLTAFFAELIHLIIEAGYSSSDVIDRAALTRKKIEMIREHISKISGNTNIADMAQLAGYTPSHFARLFKRITGQTVHQYIDVCRIERAREMLSLRMPLKAMAAELGFADKTTMARWLNKYRRAVAP